MVFSSITFLFFFLPAFLLGYHLLRFVPKLQLPFLFLSSLVFYIWGENLLVWILLTSTTIDYFCGIVISGGYKKGHKLQLVNPSTHNLRQKLGLTLSIVSNLAFLGYFKYANFFIDNFIAFADKTGLTAWIPADLSTIILPLGISFYTFQSMSYTIDVYRGNVKATRNYIKFAAYVTMFPQLIAGPIVRYSQIDEQLNKRRVTIDDFVIGIKRFVIGLAKKVIIANTLAPVQEHIFNLPSDELSTGLAWLGCITFSLQIYFDFSGYSDMAIGLGRMIGLKFPENFNYPYIARSIREFWQRWHITLTTWFRDYLYYPLGGSKKGELITYRNLIIVFIVCGLWHGPSWNYVVWGLFWGVFLIIERFKFFNKFKTFPRIFQHLYVFLVINFTVVFFKTESLKSGFHFFLVLFGINSAGTQLNSIRALLQPHVTIAFILGILFSMPVFVMLKQKINLLSEKWLHLARFAYLILLMALFVFSSVMLASGTYNPFIYFRF